MALHIYFYGLISFIGDDKAKTAVLVTYPGHKSEIATASDSTTAHEGAIIVFAGADAKGAAMADDFRDYIPELSKVIKPTPVLKPDVIQQTDTTSVNAYVKLPSGTLQVADYYEKQAEFKFGEVTARPMGCVARLTYMYLGATSPLVIVGAKKPLPLPAEGWVLIRNSCAHGDKDFKAHRHITTSQNDDDVAKALEGAHCGLSPTPSPKPYYSDVLQTINREVHEIGQVECSNSRFP